MPSEEPNSKMDDLLRAYAKKRGEQAGTEMPAYTRRLLHDEVKRTFRAAPDQAAKSPGQDWRKWRWPLAGLWGAIAVMVIMFDVLNSQMHRLAPVAATENSPASYAELKKSPDAKRKLAAPPTFDQPALREREMAAAHSVTAAPSPASPAPVLGSTLTVARPLPPPSAGSITSFAGAPVASAALAPGAAPSQQTPALVAEGAVQQFVQVPRDRAAKAAEASPPSNVLANFKLLRSGQNVSIVDADGSVYNGQVLVTGSEGYGGQQQQQQQQAADKLGVATNALNWTFNVSGINNSLQKNIVFNGNVQLLPSAAQALRTASGRGYALRDAAKDSQVQSNRNANANPLITGQLRIGGSGAFEIEARPPAQ